MSDHSGCILAIVGSRDVEKVGALLQIGYAIAEHQPLVVVSGGAKANYSNKLRGKVSIDEEAAVYARAKGIQVVEFLPTTFKFQGPGGFADRNMKIVDMCMCLVRIASTTTTTYGSGWTADRAEEAGKNVQRYLIDEKGTITHG